METERRIGIMKIYFFGFCFSLFFLIAIVISNIINERRIKKENRAREEALKEVKNEKESTKKKINSGDSKSDFDSSIDILHNYSSKRK